MLLLVFCVASGLSVPSGLGPSLALRGGAVADYSGAASELFNNMRAPAALIGGSIVPIGFAAIPEIVPQQDSTVTKALKRIHMVLAIASLSAEILAVIYSTISINKLSETTAAPTSSVTELLRRDYELPWLGCNINFLAGLFGFSMLLGLRAWFSFGARLGRVGVLIATSVLLHSVSIVNAGIAAGDGAGERFGGNFAGLLKRYLWLLFKDAMARKSSLQVGALLTLSFAAYFYATYTPE